MRLPALDAFAHPGLTMHFVSNVDGHDLVSRSSQNDRDQLADARFVFDDEHGRNRPGIGGRSAGCNAGVRCRGQLDGERRAPPVQ